MLYAQLPLIETALIAAGGTTLDMNAYCSSTVILTLTFDSTEPDTTAVEETEPNMLCLPNAINGVYAVVVHYKSRGEKEKTVKWSVTVVR